MCKTKPECRREETGRKRKKTKEERQEIKSVQDTRINNKKSIHK